MYIYSKPTDAKRYVSFKSKYLKHCLKNIPFFPARRICMITEKDFIKEIKLKKLEKLLLEHHYPERGKSRYEQSFRKPKNELRYVKQQEKKKIVPLTQTTLKPCLLLNKSWKT